MQLSWACKAWYVSHAALATRILLPLGDTTIFILTIKIFPRERRLREIFYGFNYISKNFCDAHDTPNGGAQVFRFYKFNQRSKISHRALFGGGSCLFFCSVVEVAWERDTVSLPYTDLKTNRHGTLREIFWLHYKQ